MLVITAGTTMGCWIGLSDESRGANGGGGGSGGFTWADRSAVDYVNWAHGEPNGFNGATLEDEVALLYFTEFGMNGAPPATRSCASSLDLPAALLADSFAGFRPLE